jgi:dTDP-4-dehydrorhamnose reductase
MLGQALLQKWNSDAVCGAGSQDADIRDPRQLHCLFDKARPEFTVLTAAYTDVDGCERNPQRAQEVNHRGAVHVAQAARNAGSKLLFVSSDYVFDGAKSTPYEHNDPLCPINVYGRSKADAERGIQEIIPDCCIVRTSWLFGAGGKCFPNTILELAQRRRELEVVDDQIGSPTFNSDLARAIVRLVRAGSHGIFHVTNAGACSWYQFAREVLAAAGLSTVTVKPVSTQEFPRAARRPGYSVLAGRGLEAIGVFMRPWRDTLDDYFAERSSTAVPKLGAS